MTDNKTNKKNLENQKEGFKIIVNIITAKSLFLSTQADLVLIPAADGELGVLPNHMPLIVEVKSGLMKIIANGKETKYFIYNAITEITGEYINILTEFVVDIVTISKNQILERINILEQELIRELSEHDIIAIKTNLDQQQTLLYALSETKST